MRYIFSFVLLFSLAAQAQVKNYIIGMRGDTLNRIDSKGLKQGPWIIHVDPIRGESGFEEEGYYKDNKREGRWVQFSLQGDRISVENYRWGQKDGRCDYYNHVGDLIRQEAWLAIDPKNPYDTIPITDVNDPNKIVRFQVVKVTEASVKHGTWKYINAMSGTIDKQEEWVMNRLKDAPQQEGDDMAPIDPATGKVTAKTTEKKEAAKPKQVLEFEKKNAGKKKIKVREGNTD